MDTMPVIEAGAPQAAPPTRGGPAPAAMESSWSLGGQAEATGASFGQKLARLSKIEAVQSDPDPESLGEVPAGPWALPFVTGEGPSPVAGDPLHLEGQRVPRATGTHTSPMPTFLPVNTLEPTVLLAGSSGEDLSIFTEGAVATLAGMVEGSLMPNVNGESALAPVLLGATNGTSKDRAGVVQGLGASLQTPTLSSFPITGGVQSLAATSLQAPQKSDGAPMTLLGLTGQPGGEGPSHGGPGILAGIATPQPKGNESVPLVAPQTPAEAKSGPALLPGEVRVEGVGAGTTGAIAGEALTKVLEEAATRARVGQTAHTGGDSAGSPGTHSHAAELLGKPAESTVAPGATSVVPKVTPPLETASGVPSHGRETMQLLFEPADLGRVRMQVSILAHEVRATVSVQHQGLGEFLANSQGALDGQLRQHGLRVEEFQVNTDPGRAGEGQDPTQFQGRENTETAPRPEPTESPVLLRADDDMEGEPEPMTSLLRINTFA